MNFSAVILAGGQSTRMGADKAWLPVEGEPLLGRQVAMLRAFQPVELLISGPAGRGYERFGCPVLPDAQPNSGPLAGIVAALAAIRSPFLLVLAVDLPHMSAPALRAVLEQVHPPAGVVPVVGRQVEPLAAVYPQAALPLARDALQRPPRSACRFAQDCHRKELARFYAVPPEWERCFASCNTPAGRPAAAAPAPAPPSVS